MRYLIFNNYSPKAKLIFSNYWIRLSYDMKNYADLGGCRLRRIIPSEVCIILHIIRKPNSIIVLLFIQNISRALKIYIFLIGFSRVHGKIARYLKTMNKKQEKMNKYLETKTLFEELTHLP